MFLTFFFHGALFPISFLSISFSTFSTFGNIYKNFVPENNIDVSTNKIGKDIGENMPAVRCEKAKIVDTKNGKELVCTETGKCLVECPLNAKRLEPPAKPGIPMAIDAETMAWLEEEGKKYKKEKEAAKGKKEDKEKKEPEPVKKEKGKGWLEEAEERWQRFLRHKD